MKASQTRLLSISTDARSVYRKVFGSCRNFQLKRSFQEYEVDDGGASEVDAVASHDLVALGTACTLSTLSRLVILSQLTFLPKTVPSMML